MIWGLLAVVLLAGLIALPFVLESRRAEISTLRHQAPGQFAKLSHGQTHFQWLGPEDGKVVVLIHGLTTPSFVWNALRPQLAARGYRVLSYDHYGRGYSDRPYQAQTTAFFVSHLKELLAHQGVTQPVAIIGYSMGGAVAAAFAAAHPNQVSRAALIAPAGMGHDLGAMAKLAKSLPLIGDWLMALFFPIAHRKGCEAERAAVTSTIPDIFEMQLAEQHRRGFTRSVLSSLRGLLAQDLQPQHRTIAASNIPVLALWGSLDTTIPISRKDILQNWNPNASHHVVNGAGHGLTYTHTDTIAATITTWLS